MKNIKFLIVTIFLLFFCININPVFGSEPYLVKDIAPGGNGSHLANIININSRLYFIADDGTHGYELWKSDGTTNGTVMIKDINLVTGGAFSNGLSSFKNVNGILYFFADDGINGQELWKSDGTANGTVMVKDIMVGKNSADPSYPTNVNGVLYFQATNGTQEDGYELWKSDGTANGTVMVKDINSNGSSVPKELKNINGILYFVADDGVSGQELWKSDGTANGTVMVKDINPYGSSGPKNVINVNGVLYFFAKGETHNQLWKSDGTTDGTVMIKDINSYIYSFPKNLVNVNGTLYYVTDSNVLCKSDGTTNGTVTVKKINMAYNAMVDINGVLYFQGIDTTNGHELWRSDGTSDGTVIVKDIYPNGNSSPVYFVNMNGKLYFRANNGVSGTELFAYAPDSNIPPACISWTYSDWSMCLNSVQTRTIISSSPSGCISGSPVLTRSCTQPPSMPTPTPSANTTFAKKHLGKIFLQVESKGEAWYINPKDSKKYYLADGPAAYNMMRNLGVGISNKDLDKIKTDANFRKKYIGKIFLQVESHGEAYYISSDGRYNYLKDGSAAYEIMRKFGQGITNTDLNKILAGSL